MNQAQLLAARGTVIEIGSHCQGRTVFEARGVEPVFPGGNLFLAFLAGLQLVRIAT